LREKLSLVAPNKRQVTPHHAKNGSSHLGGHGLPDWQVCVLNESFAFVIVYRVARWRGFRPAGRVSFGSRPKRNQKVLPLHTALRCAQGSFAPSPFQGHAAKGHPWPIASLAASMPLNPFHVDSAHPSERGDWWRLLVRAKRSKAQATPTIFQATRTPSPVRRPSGGVAQGDARHGRRARSEGTGTSLRDGPRSGTGRREPRRSRGRMSGALSLWLLSLSREQRESDSAGWPKPGASAHSVIALICKLKA